MNRRGRRAIRRRERWLTAVGVTVAILVGLVVLGSPAARAEVVPPYPRCIPGANPGTEVVPPGYPEGTQCLPQNRNGATISPDRSTIAWGESVTFTYAADTGGVTWSLPNEPSEYIDVVSGCGITVPDETTCTLRFRPWQTWSGLGGAQWRNVGAFSGAGRSAVAAVWVTPVLYQVHVTAQRPDGSPVTGSTTTGGVAVQAGTNPNLTECLNRQGWLQSVAAWDGVLVNGNPIRAWYPTDGHPPCSYARSVNANNPTVHPDWAFGLPAGQWDIYLWDERGPSDPNGPARQATPYSVAHVTVADADQEATTVLARRPNPQVRVEVLGSQPVPIGQTRAVTVTIDAGPAEAGYAEVDLDPADIGLRVANPALAEITSGPDPAPFPGGFQMFGGQQRVFTYQVTALAEGDADLVAAVTATDDLGRVTTDSATTNLQARDVRELQLQNLRVEPETVNDGDPFTVRADLVNTGNIDVQGITIAREIDSSVAGGADLDPPAPPSVSSLAAGASVPVSIGGTLRDARGATIRVTATGTAADNGAPVVTSERVRAGRPPSAFSVTVLAPSTVTLVPGPGGLEPADVDVVVRIRNDGTEVVENVEIPASPARQPVAPSTEDPLEVRPPEPDGWIGTLAPGEQREITYGYRAVRTGTIDVVALGYGEVSGDGLTEQGQARIAVNDRPDLVIDTSKVASKAEQNEKLDARITVTNPSATETVTDVRLDGLATTGPAVQILAEPEGSDQGFTLAPGQSRTVQWRLRYTEVGTSQVTFGATGRKPSLVTASAKKAIEVRPPAKLRWGMEKRFDGPEDEVTDYAGAHPTSWRIDFSLPVAGGCQDATLDLRDVTPSGETPIVPAHVDPATCTWRLQLSPLAPFRLRATWTHEGTVLADETEDIDPKDLVIVSVGDSMSSGEGARDPGAGWTDDQCNRSWLAGPAQAAYLAEDDGDAETLEDAHSSVTFIHLACSGANTPRGLLGPYKGIRPNGGGIGPSLPYQPPQLLTIPSILGDREVDALLMTSGINDIVFADFLSHCLGNDDCPSVPLGGQDLGDVISGRLADLPRMYQELADWMPKLGIDQDKVFLLEYPDPSKDENGDYCDSGATTVIKGHITPEEYQWLDEHMQTPLNSRGAEGAAAHGWHRVGGVAAGFRTHGVCATARWSNTVPDSIGAQGNYYGAFHPNPVGHTYFGQRIYGEMQRAGVGASGNGTSSATSVEGGAAAGEDRVELRNDRFEVGDDVVINPGGANEETHTVAAKGSLIFAEPLRFDHGDGELIVLATEAPSNPGASTPPTAVDDEATVPESGPATLDVLANDTDPDSGDTLRISGWSGSSDVAPSFDGKAMLWDRPGRSCDPATFTYTAIDQTGAESLPATVTVTPDCPTGDLFHALAAPTRILDSRPPPEQVGPHATPWGPGEIRDVAVAGVGGVPADATAVVLNVTVTGTTAPSFLTVWPKGHAQPTASNLNWSAGQTIPNAVTAKVGDDGKVQVFNNSGSAHVIVDVVGWYDQSGTGAGFTSLSPARVLDSRPPPEQVGPYSTPWTPGIDREVTVAGVAGVPAGADAVVVNATVTGTTAESFLTIYPNGATRPTASNLNWTAGVTIPNAVTVKVGDDGKIRVFNNSGSANVILDVVGWFETGGGDAFHPVPPVRLQDSRPPPETVGAHTTPWPAAGERTVSVLTGAAVPNGAKAVLINVTATSTSAESFLTVWDTGATRPTASSLNWTAGITIANAVTAKVGSGESISVYNNSGTVHVIADAAGWYG